MPSALGAVDTKRGVSVIYVLSSSTADGLDLVRFEGSRKAAQALQKKLGAQKLHRCNLTMKAYMKKIGVKQ